MPGRVLYVASAADQGWRYERRADMSALSNAEAMRAGYAAFSRGDMDTLRKDLFTPDIVWHQGGRNQTSGDYRGPDEVIGLFGKLFQLTARTFRVQNPDELSSEDHDVFMHHAASHR